MKFRIRYADQVVGAFVVLAMTLLAVIIVVLGARQRWFARDFTYNSRFPSSTGVAVGTPLLYKGFQIGRIHSVHLNEADEVDVEFIVYDTFAEKVRENSLLELVTSPIGLGSQLLFHQGKSEVALPEGAFIPSFDTPEGLRLVDEELVDRPPKDDTITRLISNVNATIVELEKALSQINKAMAGTGSGPIADAMADAAKSVEGVKILIGQVNSTLSDTAPELNRIVAEVDATLPSLLKSVDDSMASVAVMGKNFEQTSEALKDPTGLIPRLLDPKGSLKTFLDDGDVLFNRVDNSLAAVEKSLGNLEGTTATLAAEMPRIAATIDEARTAIVGAQDVMEGLKNNPILRGGIPDRVEPQAAPTSLRNTEF